MVLKKKREMFLFRTTNRAANKQKKVKELYKTETYTSYALSFY